MVKHTVVYLTEEDIVNLIKSKLDMNDIGNDTLIKVTCAVWCRDTRTNTFHYVISNDIEEINQYIADTERQLGFHV